MRHRTQFFSLCVKVVMLACLLSFGTKIQAQDFRPVNMLVPKFQSPKKESRIGRRAAVIFGLQIWRTYSTATRFRSSFDNAEIVYNSQSAPTTFAELEKLARSQRKKPNLILWGRASRYGDGIVVESNLLIPTGWYANNLGNKVWTVEIPSGPKFHTVSVDVPSRQYEFAPIVLDPKILTIADATSTSANIYLQKSTLSEIVGNVAGSGLKALRHDGDWSQVELQNSHRLGWIYLPQLSKSPSEVVNFCGAIIRFLRKDWPGSVELFQEVLNNNRIPTAVKIDSYLYMAMAYDKMQQAAKSLSLVAEAYKLNPYSKTTTQYLVMAHLARLTHVIRREPNGEEAKDIMRSLKDILLKNKILFADNDSWIVQAEMVLDELGEANGDNG